jgi:ribosomal protein S18 acetylase RimI-like enzyme
MDTTSTWDGLSVEVTHEIHADSREVINRGLTEFNTQHLGDHKWVALDVYVRDPEGQVVGGLIGGSVFDRLYIYALWVAKGRRRLGLGTRILRAAEKTAVERGCRIVFLDTLTFQAPEFYERNGYQRIATVDFQPGVKKIYLQKRLQG